MAQSRVAVEVRRRQLVDVALAIAERDGPAAVTARAVATEAGVSLGLVHYCFDTTQELGALVAERLIEQLAEAALPVLETPESPTDVRELLGAAITSLWVAVEATRGRRLFTFEMAAYAVRTPGLEAVGARQYEVADRGAGGILAFVGQVAGVSWSTDVEELARLIVMAVDGATFRWLADRDSARALTSLGHVADLIATHAVPR